MATPLGTLDRTPPPFFRQGPSALTKLTLCSALAIFLMVADTRFKLTHPLRTMVATVLHPVERVLRVPVDAWNAVGDYAMGLQNALTSEAAARAALAQQAERAARVEQLLYENNRLRALLGLRSALTVRSQPAEVLYEASDPFSRKVVIDRGTTQGVALASPVINDAGVLGQVTRVYPLSSEVTLLTDKDAAIPVLNTRNQLRSAAFGTAGAAMELRFMAGNADVQVGDQLHTSGVDGVYPPGLPVAKVLSVDRKVDTGFARVQLAPAALPDGVRHVLVLEPLSLQMPPRPEPTADEVKPAAKARKGAKK
ncbi:rod shape-determining protein MreC [Piscinibacter sp. XHJ-5]|uniref:rod shape-determining protein MreC n=1 Tax=Piscinibacter sp. XHJ-5 TaxID=3037797 RepID=UPI002452C1CA|nr:rod shape-determining protein MreC [Piscinibacter sp. XHJ-5]